MVNEFSWTIVAAPNEGWATAVLGEPDVERLWDAVATTMRLDEDDPVEAWRLHAANLKERADALNAYGSKMGVAMPLFMQNLFGEQAVFLLSR